MNIGGTLVNHDVKKSGTFVICYSQNFSPLISFHLSVVHCPLHKISAKIMCDKITGKHLNINLHIGFKNSLVLGPLFYKTTIRNVVEQKSKAESKYLSTVL